MWELFTTPVVQPCIMWHAKSLVLGVSLATVVALSIEKAPAKPPIAYDMSMPVDVSEAAGGYRDFNLMTPRPVMTNVELAMLCRGAYQGDVEQARKTLGPHAYAEVSIFMNDLAADVFRKHQTAATQPAENHPTTQPAKVAYPVGSAIVKEKHGQFYQAAGVKRDMESTLDGIGGMIKRQPGFDPDHGDWVYFYKEPNKRVEFGKIETCVKCHEGSASTDHVFGNWARGL